MSAGCDDRRAASAASSFADALIRDPKSRGRCLRTLPQLEFEVTGLSLKMTEDNSTSRDTQRHAEFMRRAYAVNWAGIISLYNY